jgi:hypothetical protein
MDCERNPARQSVKSAFVRFSWISWAAARRLCPDSALLTELATLGARREEHLKAPATHEAPQARDLRLILGWIRHPQVSNVPNRQVRSTALSRAPAQARAAVQWVDEAAAVLSQMPRREISDRERLTWLRSVALTEFPTLLLWRNPTAARRIFEADGTNGTRVRYPDTERRAIKQATRLCLGYLFSSLGRFGPRAGFTGTGFFSDALGEVATATVCRPKEVISIEPDLSWFARHWALPRNTRVHCGLTAWSVLETAVKRTRNRSRRIHLSILKELRDAAEKLGHSALHFSTVDRFLVDTDAKLRTTVDAKNWREHPHRWWVARRLDRELPFPAGLDAAVDVCAQASFPSHLVLGHDTPTITANIPYPSRVLALCPERVALSSEEFFDWILDTESTNLVSPRTPHIEHDRFARIAREFNGGLKFLAFEPNPRRSAERHAIHYRPRPSFCAPLSGMHLASPSNLVDNRLVRLTEVEVRAPESAGQHFFMSTLLCDQTAKLFEIEIAGPEYAAAPDIIPRFVSMGEMRRDIPGALDERSGIWILSNMDVMLILDQGYLALSAIYFLTVHTRIGAPTWLEAIIGGARSVFPSHSLMAWDCIARNLRNALPQSAAISALVPNANLSFIVNEEGESLPAEWIVRTS